MSAVNGRYHLHDGDLSAIFENIHIYIKPQIPWISKEHTANVCLSEASFAKHPSDLSDKTFLVLLETKSM